jgi:hypothetical protein
MASRKEPHYHDIKVTGIRAVAKWLVRLEFLIQHQWLVQTRYWSGADNKPKRKGTVVTEP